MLNTYRWYFDLLNGLEMSYYRFKTSLALREYLLKVIQFLFGSHVKVYFHASIYYVEFPWKQLSFVSHTMNMNQQI